MLTTKNVGCEVTEHEARRAEIQRYPSVLLGIIKDYLQDFEQAIITGRWFNNPSLHLREACRAGWTDILPLFARVSVDWTAALYAAAKAGQFELIKILLIKTGLPATNILPDAIASGSMQCVIYCIDEQKMDRETLNRHMCVAAGAGHNHLVDIFWDLGAKNYNNCFAAAASGGHITIMHRFKSRCTARAIKLVFNDVAAVKQSMVLKLLRKWRIDIVNKVAVICTVSVKLAAELYTLSNVTTNNVFASACCMNNVPLMTICGFIGATTDAFSNVLSCSTLQRAAVRTVLAKFSPRMFRAREIYELGFGRDYKPKSLEEECLLAIWRNDRAAVGKLVPFTEREYFDPIETKYIDDLVVKPMFVTGDRSTFCNLCHIKFRGYDQAWHAATAEHALYIGCA